MTQSKPTPEVMSAAERICEVFYEKGDGPINLVADIISEETAREKEELVEALEKLRKAAEAVAYAHTVKARRVAPGLIVVTQDGPCTSDDEDYMGATEHVDALIRKHRGGE